MRNREGLVLITGGAGFIGSHVSRALVAAGRRVRLLDRLEPQVHRDVPELPEGVELLQGDVTDTEVWSAAMNGVDAVIHLAAAVGVGQSMYEIVRYCSTNVIGTARLLESVTSRPGQVRKLLVASSMSIYGEGAYQCPDCRVACEQERQEMDLVSRRWELFCRTCGNELVPIPTPEEKKLRPSSVYAINKRDQEEMCLTVGRAYDIPTVALRFFNVYGPGQALENPYTGVAAIFAARLLAGRPPLVFEDGRQTRDFVHVHDVAKACLAALAAEISDVSINIGTGRPTSVLDVAAALRGTVGGPAARVLGFFRSGDIRHCLADTSLANRLLGWQPEVPFEEGIPDLLEWIRKQAGDGAGQARAIEELHSRGLVRG